MYYIIFKFNVVMQVSRKDEEEKREDDLKSMGVQDKEVSLDGIVMLKKHGLHSNGTRDLLLHRPIYGAAIRIHILHI